MECLPQILGGREQVFENNFGNTFTFLIGKAFDHSGNFSSVFFEPRSKGEVAEEVNDNIQTTGHC